MIYNLDEIKKKIIEYCEMISDTINRYGRDFDTFENDNDYRHSISFSVLQIGEPVTGLCIFLTCTAARHVP